MEEQFMGILHLLPIETLKETIISNGAWYNFEDNWKINH